MRTSIERLKEVVYIGYGTETGELTLLQKYKEDIIPMEKTIIGLGKSDSVRTLANFLEVLTGKTFKVCEDGYGLNAYSEDYFNRAA